uniref:Anthranilate phosphoribosyltransferase n=1 Tax=Anthurium amnicola TaxID=1678845 RepID=A0A1D1XHH5_9ARAE
MAAATPTFLQPPLHRLPASRGSGPVGLRLGGRGWEALRVAGVRSAGRGRASSSLAAACLLDSAGGGGAGDAGKKGGGGVGAVPNSNYVVPLDKAAPGIIRPLGEILRDLNKKVNENIINTLDRSIPWYHVNRLLSFYAPGWNGEIRNVIFSDKGTVTVVYRVTVRGSDGEAHRESSGTVSNSDGMAGDPVALAEEVAFCRACARFGLGLYLYHEEDNL